MRPRRFLILAGVLLLLAAIVTAALLSPQGRLDAVLVQANRDLDVRTQKGNRLITFQVRNKYSQPVSFTGGQRIQLRMTRGWEAPQPLPFSDEASDLDEGATSSPIMLAVPDNTQSVRLLLEYRVGGSPYCKAYFFLSRHGICQTLKAPSRLALRLFPREAMKRHVQIDLAWTDQPPAGHSAVLSSATH